jgi:hypothetical protein
MHDYFRPQSMPRGEERDRESEKYPPIIFVTYMPQVIPPRFHLHLFLFDDCYESAVVSLTFSMSLLSTYNDEH